MTTISIDYSQIEKWANELKHSSAQSVYKDMNELLNKHKPKTVIRMHDALAMGRKDYAHSECPDDCSGCEHFHECVYPVMT